MEGVGVSVWRENNWEPLLYNNQRKQFDLEFSQVFTLKKIQLRNNFRGKTRTFFYIYWIIFGHLQYLSDLLLEPSAVQVSTCVCSFRSFSALIKGMLLKRFISPHIDTACLVCMTWAAWAVWYESWVSPLCIAHASLLRRLFLCKTVKPGCGSYSLLSVNLSKTTV